MDRRIFLNSLKGLTSNKRKLALVCMWTASLLVALTAAWVGLSRSHHAGKVAQEQAAKDDDDSDNDNDSDDADATAKPEPGAISGLVKRYADAIESFQDKLYQLRTADQENDRLRLENASLRLKIESMRFDCHAVDAANLTHEYEFRLSDQTRSRVGRMAETIMYRPPTHLLPPQLYTLGVSYFKAGEIEKAAMIFSFLTDLQDNDAYKTPRNYLMTGIAWYRIDNFSAADKYFDLVLKTPEAPENLQFLAQARLWKGLTAERTGHPADAQKWYRDLVDHHPHSMEAAWVNGTEQANTEVNREPATHD